MNLEILKIASNTKNFKDIKKYTHHSKSKNPLCGDEIHIKLVINDQKIIDISDILVDLNSKPKPLVVKQKK